MNFHKDLDSCVVFLQLIDSSQTQNEYKSTGLDLEQNKINIEKVKENVCDYQVNEFNLLSNDQRKIYELIQMNLNVMLKRDYVLTGVINSSKTSIRDYKMLFKKVGIIKSDFSSRK